MLKGYSQALATEPKASHGVWRCTASEPLWPRPQAGHLTTPATPSAVDMRRRAVHALDQPLSEDVRGAVT